MNLKTSLTAAAALLAILSAGHADSKRTAEYLLSDPQGHQSKEVTLDVAFVNPVRWVSPYPDLAFFQAVTIDRTDRKPGGRILVAVPAADSAKFAKKYGTDFDGRNDKDTLRGEFLAVGGHRHRKIWVVDTTGQLAEMMAKKMRDLPDDAPRKGAPGRRGGLR